MDVMKKSTKKRNKADKIIKLNFKKLEFLSMYFKKLSLG